VAIVETVGLEVPPQGFVITVVVVVNLDQEAPPYPSCSDSELRLDRFSDLLRQVSASMRNS
jgi:hypothetical protein